MDHRSISEWVIFYSYKLWILSAKKKKNTSYGYSEVWSLNREGFFFFFFVLQILLSTGPYWTGPDQSAQISINELQTSPTTQIIWANCHSRLSCANCLTLSGLQVHTLGILTHRFYLFLNQKGYRSKLNLFIRIF